MYSPPIRTHKRELRGSHENQYTTNVHSSIVPTHRPSCIRPDGGRDHRKAFGGYWWTSGTCENKVSSHDGNNHSVQSSGRRYRISRDLQPGPKQGSHSHQDGFVRLRCRTDGPGSEI